jgi:hypothetical protein
MAGVLGAGGLLRMARFLWVAGFLRGGLLRRAGFLGAGGLVGPMVHIGSLSVICWLRVRPPITPTAIAHVLAIRTN